MIKWLKQYQIPNWLVLLMYGLGIFLGNLLGSGKLRY